MALCAAARARSFTCRVSSRANCQTKRMASKRTGTSNAPQNANRYRRTEGLLTGRGRARGDCIRLIYDSWPAFAPLCPRERGVERSWLKRIAELWTGTLQLDGSWIVQADVTSDHIRDELMS